MWGTITVDIFHVRCKTSWELSRNEKQTNGFAVLSPQRQRHLYVWICAHLSAHLRWLNIVFQTRVIILYRWIIFKSHALIWGELESWVQAPFDMLANLAGKGTRGECFVSLVTPPLGLAFQDKLVCPLNPFRRPHDTWITDRNRSYV